MSNFTLGEWCDTEKENFQAAEDVRAKVNELQETLHAICKANDIPYLSLTIDGCGENGYEVSSSQNLPIKRVPAELLVISAVADKGLESAMTIATELFLGGRR